MAKSDAKAHQWRMDGMVYALDLVKRKGVKALEDEVRMRNGRFIPLELSREKQVEVSTLLASRIVNTYSVITLATLYDRWGWRKTRLQRFVEQFNAKCELVDVLDPYGEHYALISDYGQMLKEECGINIDLDMIYAVERDREEGKKRR